MLTKKEAKRLEEIETQAIHNAMTEIYLDDWIGDADIKEYRRLKDKAF